MRVIAATALFGTGLCIAQGQAQTPSAQGQQKSTSEQREKAPAKSSEKSYGTSRTDSLTENAPERPHSSLGTEAAEPPAKGEATKPAPIPAPAAASRPVVPTVAPAPPGPPPKDFTPEELASLKVGVSQEEMLRVLGPPSSRLSNPGDDGHMRETCQYWAKGKPVATIRLDNGRVVSIDIKSR